MYTLYSVHKTHSQHVKKMQGNIKIVLTLSILKNKNTVTTDWIENKINKVHNGYLCFIEFKVGNWSEKKSSLFCFVCQYVISRYWYNFQYQYILLAF